MSGKQSRNYLLIGFGLLLQGVFENGHRAIEIYLRGLGVDERQSFTGLLFSSLHHEPVGRLYQKEDFGNERQDGSGEGDVEGDPERSKVVLAGPALVGSPRDDGRSQPTNVHWEKVVDEAA
jgi:hypothetical protein